MNKDTKSYFPILEKYAQKNKQFTINDAASVTGLPVLETEYSIKEMMEKYDCKLKVTENQVFLVCICIFDISMHACV